ATASLSHEPKTGFATLLVFPLDPIAFLLNPTATSEIYTLSLHDALPILRAPGMEYQRRVAESGQHQDHVDAAPGGVLQGLDEGRVGQEIRHGDVYGFLRALERRHQGQVHRIAVAAIGLVGQTENAQVACRLPRREALAGTYG